MKKKLIIVGGGHAGVNLASELDKFLEVTLIDQKDTFVHSPATIRSVVVPDLFERLLIPYDRLLKQGNFIQAKVQKVYGQSVFLENGRKLTADYTVVATGSEYAQPFKTNGESIEALRKVHTLTNAMIAQNDIITVIGGGPVGVELVGEIKAVFPEKQVNLVSRDRTLFPHMEPKLGESLVEQLTEMEVNLYLGVGGATDGPITKPHIGEVKITDGRTIELGLIFPVFGAKASNEILKAIGDVKLDRYNRAGHDGWLRPSRSHPSLFACGDAVNTGDDMTIVAVNRQTPWLAKTLKALASGKPIEKVKKYTPWPIAPILVPLGPKYGASLIPVFNNGKVFRGGVTRSIKGKDVFVNKYRKLLDQKD